jgi:hypothetical protein
VSDADSPSFGPALGADPVDVDRPNIARMYDYYLGGSHNFAVDRQAAERVKQANPSSVVAARENRAFLGRVVRFCLASGVRQFLDLGSGIPTVGNVHEIAHHVDPATRIAYVDNEPVAVAHARSLLSDVDTATITAADLRDPDTVLSAPGVAGLLDFTQPIALLAMAVLHCVSDTDDPPGILARYRAALAPGSYLALSHITLEHLETTRADAGQTLAEVYRNANPPSWARTRDEIGSWLSGLSLVEPGLVIPRQWQPAPGDPAAPPNTPSMWWAAVARL